MPLVYGKFSSPSGDCVEDSCMITKQGFFALGLWIGGVASAVILFLC